MQDDSRVNEDLSNLLKIVEAPTLLLWGELDDATPLKDGIKMEKLITVGLCLRKGLDSVITTTQNGVLHILMISNFH